MAISDLVLLQDTLLKQGQGSVVPEMIHILRKHLGMDIAFLGQFSNCAREIRLVDTDELICAIRPGHATPLEESYCKLIVDGKLPSVMNDVTDYPLATALKVTAELDIRSYIAAPIYLADGTVYGTLCCYSHTPHAAFSDRDLSMMRACAEMTARQIDQERLRAKNNRDLQARITSIMDENKLSTVYQPICDLRNRRITGFEALSRFNDDLAPTPDVIFCQAHDVGMGPELERKAIQLALKALDHLDADVYVAVNASPDTILSSDFSAIFHNYPLARVVLEITEHAAVSKYHEIKEALTPLRNNGMQLAVDDAGGGFSSFRHILELAPDRVKLDGSLTKNIDSDPVRRALVAAFVRFTQDTSMKLIAEGVQTAMELQALRDLGVEKAQGFYLGKPVPLSQVLQTAYPE